MLSSFFFFPGIDKKSRIAFFALLVFGLIWRSYAWYLQPGAYLDDEIGHYLIAHQAWKDPQFIFSFWGRTACTLFYMPGAFFSWELARTLSVLAASLTIFYAAHISLIFGIRKFWLIPLLLDFQPWFYNNTHELLTEIPAMLLLTAGIYYALISRITIASFLIGALPLARHELVSLTALWGLYCLYKKEWLQLLWTASLFVIANLLSYLVYDVLPIKPFFTPQGTKHYGSGTWSHFFIEMANSTHAGLPILVLAVAGLYFILSKPRSAVVFLWCFALIAVNTIIYRFGLYSSGGFGIFLLPIAPIIAITAAAGFEHLWIATQRFKSQAFSLPFKLLTLSLLCWFTYFGINNLKPRALHSESQDMAEIAAYIRAEKLSNRKIAAMNVWFYYYLPLELPHQGNLWFRTLWSSNQLTSLNQGDLLVWDPHYSDRWGHDYQKLKTATDWRLLKEWLLKEHRRGALFEKIS